MAVSPYNKAESSQADTVDIWVEFNNTAFKKNNNTAFITFIFAISSIY